MVRKVLKLCRSVTELQQGDQLYHIDCTGMVELSVS